MKLEHDEGSSNTSENRPFYDVLAVRKSRRQILAGGLGLAATTFLATPGISLAAPGMGKGKPGNTPLLNFTPVPVAGGGTAVPRISADYNFDIILPWGDPIQPGGPVFNYPPSSADQALQIGIGHDGMWFFSLGKGNSRNEHGLLVINHEYGTNPHVLGKAAPQNLEDVRVSLHAHGVSVIEIKLINGKWQPVTSNYARRIHGNTDVTFSGPVAGSPLLNTPAGNSPKGTLNNCANGYTPWGTYLTCEENFNGYFGSSAPWSPSPEQDRYGFSSGGFGYGWHNFDPRFDLSNPDYVNEENRFGWVVEIDPERPWEAPVKRTALGRFKHEGIAIAEGRGGRIVGYMGDDEAFDYIYKFVSDKNWKAMRAQGLSPLDEGKLYAARFNDDGTGEWLELTIDNPALSAVFQNQAEVLTYARMAADILGATPMDRPEWTTVTPDGQVYITLTNNSGRRTADAANPLAPNPDGHIIKWRDSDQFVGTDFVWDVFMIARDTHGTEDSYADPDGLWADDDGRLFIQTDGGQKDGLNNQMLVVDPATGDLRRLFEGVRGDEITGIAVTPDRKTMFVNVQHPGNGSPSQTNFPVMNMVPDGITIPRDATVVITRKDGGIIGS